MVATKTTSAAQAVVFWTSLTPAERHVGAAMAQGWTNSKIADQLALSHKTVENRVSAIYERLPAIAGFDSRVQAVLFVKSVLEAGGPAQQSA